jgi:hypothetical protein
LLLKSLRTYFIASTLSRLAFLLATFFVPPGVQKALMGRVKRLKFAFPTLRDVLSSVFR